MIQILGLEYCVAVQRQTNLRFYYMFPKYFTQLNFDGFYINFFISSDVIKQTYKAGIFFHRETLFISPTEHVGSVEAVKKHQIPQEKSLKLRLPSMTIRLHEDCAHFDSDYPECKWPFRP